MKKLILLTLIYLAVLVLGTSCSKTDINRSRTFNSEYPINKAKAKQAAKPVWFTDSRITF